MKKLSKTNKDEIKILCDRKIKYFKKLGLDTIDSIREYNKCGIVTSQCTNKCIDYIETVISRINDIDLHYKFNYETKLKKLQEINDTFFSLFQMYGTQHLKDILNVCFGVKYIDTIMKDMTYICKDKFHLLLENAMPYKFKSFYNNSKQKKTSKIENGKTNTSTDINLNDSAKTLDVFNITDEDTFNVKTNGIRIVFKDNSTITVIVYCITKPVIMQCIDNHFKHLYSYDYQVVLNQLDNGEDASFKRYLSFMNLKDILVTEKENVYTKFKQHSNELNDLKQKSISQVVKDFLNMNLFEQRNMISLYMLCDDVHCEYMGYLLYDMLTSETNDVNDNIKQKQLYNSLNWNVQKRFRESMEHTVEYTNELSSIDDVQIPYEQQICLMKTSKCVKERAIVKLKEIKSKSEDSGSKARLYLDGLLKIPFEIYRKEPILCTMDVIRDIYLNIIKKCSVNEIDLSLNNVHKITSIELLENVRGVRKKLDILKKHTICVIEKHIVLLNKNQLKNVIFKMNDVFKQLNMSIKLKITSKSVKELKDQIVSALHKTTNLEDEYKCIRELTNYLKLTNIYDFVVKQITKIDSIWNGLNREINKNNSILNDAVYGHKDAKRNVERILGQWINGENKGYCFGFEGPPGVGKTSLAKKGLSKCLKDNDGTYRPFHFIALGGSSNASTLDGHNYTYVGSTWGRIVDILMNSKCMNPIIFIDELDKVSRTEHGKEIVGILTHLVDQTQNDDFQDKYFSGISLDLSKVLFIFSYNDVDKVDKILLDRIHRIKFDNLNLDEKLVIAKKHLLPEILKDIGLTNGIIEIQDDTLMYIINKYTNEPGVRKFKELLYVIVSELNLEILKNENNYIGSLPINVTKDMIETKYLSDRHPRRILEIPEISTIGQICGLWANSLGMGGILHIQGTIFYSSNMFELKLTGMQGDVMKESMNVSKTIAFNMTNEEVLKKMTNKKINKGIHIHCPEGAVPKDGPSAGAAITTVIYSLLNNLKIKRDHAITGEINLSGKITAIGGLQYKILGGLDGRVKTFMYPKENQRDFDEVVDKFPYILNKATFIPVDNINEVFEIIFEN